MGHIPLMCAMHSLPDISELSVYSQGSIHCFVLRHPLTYRLISNAKSCHDGSQPGYVLQPPLKPMGNVLNSVTSRWVYSFSHYRSSQTLFCWSLFQPKFCFQNSCGKQAHVSQSPGLQRKAKHILKNNFPTSLSSAQMTEPA